MVLSCDRMNFINSTTQDSESPLQLRGMFYGVSRAAGPGTGEPACVKHARLKAAPHLPPLSARYLTYQVPGLL